jgi:hypothetical protein
MAFVALWVPLSQGLLTLEAQDHPTKPQGVLEIVAFYAGSAVMFGGVIAIIWIVIFRRAPRPAHLPRGTEKSSNKSTPESRSQIPLPRTET